jgi:hypothetical protein
MEIPSILSHTLKLTDNRTRISMSWRILKSRPLHHHLHLRMKWKWMRTYTT